MEDWYHMVLWMSVSLEILETERNETVARESVLDYLSYATTRVSESADLDLFTFCPSAGVIFTLW